jgi:hypothetical protein
MELFLNLAWLLLSAMLIAGYVVCAHSSVRSWRWTIVIALTLLIIILLPAISMTDDLAAINNPAETDHLLRRHQIPLDLHWDVAFAAIVPLLIGIFAISVAQASIEKFKARFLTSVLLDSALRTLGLRPPPAFSSVAA